MFLIDKIHMLDFVDFCVIIKEDASKYNNFKTELTMRYRNEQCKRIYNYVTNLLLLLISTVVFSVIWDERINVLMDNPFQGKGNILINIVYLLVLLFMLYIFQSLKVGYFTLANLLISRCIAYICAHIIIAVQVILMVGTVRGCGSILLRMAETLAITEVLCICYTIIVTKIYNKLIPPYRMLMVYGDYENSLKEKIDRREDKYKIVDEIYIGEDEEVIKERMLCCDAVVLNDIPTEKRKSLLKHCFEHDIRVYFVPKISDVFVKGSDELKLFDTPVFLCRNIQLLYEQRIVKRVMDVLMSSILLILSSPIMLVTCIAIKIEDGGTVFYKQKRCTTNGKIFEMMKFRSMRMDAEKIGGVQLAKENDSRITKVGEFIRKTRIDELPQLINILKGDMSFVGPRPERPELVEENCKTVPEFSYRMKVKAGLTGYAQVYGKYNTTFLDKLKMDLLYIEKYSLWLDIEIILMTIKVVFMKESTEGF